MKSTAKQSFPSAKFDKTDVINGFKIMTTQANNKSIFEIPFLGRMGFVFFICVIGMVLISKLDARRGVQSKGLAIDRSMFKLSPSFTVGALIICGVLAAFYTVFW